MFPSPTGKPVNMDALTSDVIVPIITKAGIPRRGWHAFRRGLTTCLHRQGVSDFKESCAANVGVTQTSYIKTSDSDAKAAMAQMERSLEYAPSMHLSGPERPRVM